MVAELVQDIVMWNSDGIHKTLWPYMGPRLRCEDAWSSFAFGSTDTWRQLTGSIHDFKVMGVIFGIGLQLCE